MPVQARKASISVGDTIGLSPSPMIGFGFRLEQSGAFPNGHRERGGYIPRTRSTRGSCFFSPGWNDVAWRWIKYDRYPYDWSAVMLVHRWKKPLVLGDRRIRIVVGSPEEAMNWLIHEPNQTSDKWRRAWQACRAAIDGRMAAEDAKSAVQLAVER